MTITLNWPSTGKKKAKITHTQERPHNYLFSPCCPLQKWKPEHIVLKAYCKHYSLENLKELFMSQGILIK